MSILPLIIIFGAGLVTGMYVSSQIEKSIDRHININTKKTKKKKQNE